MSQTIIIQGTPIAFPSSNDSPNWAPAVIQFAQAVATALTLTVGTYDISPQNFVIDNYNAVANQSIPALQFSTANVRAALIRYSVYRNTTTTTVHETGLMKAVYDTSNGWEMDRNYTGEAKIAFNITSGGQVQFSTNATTGTNAANLGGTNHNGKIAFAATALTQV